MIFPNIIGSNVCQLQTSLTQHCIVKSKFFTIYYKAISSGNFFGVFGVFSVLNMLSIKKSDLISNIMRSDCYGTTYYSLLRNQLFSILKCAISIAAV